MVRVPIGPVKLEGNLTLPSGARGVVLFAHGSGSSRNSPRNRVVAKQLQSAGFGTLLIDLLTEEEEAVDLRTSHFRFDIGLLANRLVGAVGWLQSPEQTEDLPVGLFGASTGGGAALVAAAQRPDCVAAVVSRGGRPDLAGEFLSRVRAPTLLLVGGNDVPIIGMNQQAMRAMRTEIRLTIIPGASHLFEEPGTIQQVATHARDWFERFLPRAESRAA